MQKENIIQTFNPFELEEELNKKSGQVPYSLGSAHAIFHINLIEEYMKAIPFPAVSDLSPRRITLFSFLFLTEGTSKRTKSLMTYDFGKNTFFFVPALEITTHEYMSPDAKGYYCHFSFDLLTALVAFAAVLGINSIKKRSNTEGSFF